LPAQGVTVEVVTWITSDMAAVASAGIAVTHREHSQGVIFVTCHNKHDSVQPNWQALADFSMTLVIYVGIACCSQSQRSLSEAGMAAAMSVAVIQSATLSVQAGLLTTLARLPADLQDSDLGSPNIIVIGEVVRDADVLGAIVLDDLQQALG